MRYNLHEKENRNLDIETKLEKEAEEHVKNGYYTYLISKYTLLAPSTGKIDEIDLYGNIEKALHYLNLGIEAKDANSYVRLAKLYRDGYIFQQDRNKASELLKEGLSIKKEVDTLIILSELYRGRISGLQSTYDRIHSENKFEVDFSLSYSYAKEAIIQATTDFEIWQNQNKASEDDNHIEEISMEMKLRDAERNFGDFNRFGLYNLANDFTRGSLSCACDRNAALNIYNFLFETKNTIPMYSEFKVDIEKKDYEIDAELEEDIVNDYNKLLDILKEDPTTLVEYEVKRNKYLQVKEWMDVPELKHEAGNNNIYAMQSLFELFYFGITKFSQQNGIIDFDIAFDWKKCFVSTFLDSNDISDEAFEYYVEYIYLLVKHNGISVSSKKVLEIFELAHKKGKPQAEFYLTTLKDNKEINFDDIDLKHSAFKVKNFRSAQAETQKSTKVNLSKADIIKLGYYAISLVLMFFPLYSVSSYYGNVSASLYDVAFNYSPGFWYLATIIASISTLFVKSLQGFKKLAFIVTPIVEFVILFNLHSLLMGIPLSPGFWLSVVLHLCAIAYHWYPMVSKIINEKQT